MKTPGLGLKQDGFKTSPLIISKMKGLKTGSGGVDDSQGDDYFYILAFPLGQCPVVNKPD